jgi:hypothetical protein
MLAQTTDSGSNNNTMASTMYALINEIGNGKMDWDPTTMHVRCMCHNIALIVNAGLSALSLKTLPSSKAKESVLGFFPVRGRLVEEEEPETTSSSTQSPADGISNGLTRNNDINQSLDSDSDYGNADDEGSTFSEHDELDPGDDSVTVACKEKHIKSTKLQELTTKVCFS